MTPSEGALGDRFVIIICIIVGIIGNVIIGSTVRKIHFAVICGYGLHTAGRSHV